MMCSQLVEVHEAVSEGVDCMVLYLVAKFRYVATLYAVGGFVVVELTDEVAAGEVDKESGTLGPRCPVLVNHLIVAPRTHELVHEVDAVAPSVFTLGLLHRHT